MARIACGDRTIADVKRSIGRPFTLLWTSSAMSAVGTGMTVTALPLVAATLPDSSFALSVIAAASMVPEMLFAVPAGLLTDRLDRRMLLIASDLLRGVVVLGAMIALVTDSVGLIALAAIAFLIGVGDTVFVAASQAFLPAVVRSADLDEANGRLQVAEDTGREFVGPPVGSWAFSLVSWLPFGIDAVSYALSASVLVRLPASDAESENDTAREVADEGPGAGGSSGAATGDTGGMGQAWRFFRHSRPLVVLSIGMFVLALTGSAVLAQMVLIVRDHLDVSEAWYGVLLTVIALGATAAGLFAGRLRIVLSAKPAMIVAAAVNAISYLLLGATGRWPVAVVAFAIWGMSVTFGNITSIGIRQRAIPSQLLGRTMSLYRMSLGAGGLVGALASGIVVSTTSIGSLALIAGAAQIPVVLLFLIGLPNGLDDHRALQRLRDW
jgi:MFS family permease